MQTDQTAFKKSILVLSIVAGTCIIAMLVVAISSISGLTNAVKNWTNNYIRDVSKQSAQVIEDRFRGFNSALKLIANNLVDKNNIEREQILKTNAVLSQFDELLFIDQDGNKLTVFNGNTVDESSGLHNYEDSIPFTEVWSGREVAGLFNNKIAFMEPMQQDNKTLGVLIGVRAKERLESILVNDAFNGKGVTFIIDQFGRILIEPSDQKKINQFGDNNITDLALEIAMDYGSKHEQATLNKQTESGINLLIDYRPLGIFDWTVVTMVQENFLVEEVNGYVIRMIAVVIVLAGVFMTLFIVMIAMQSRYQQHLEDISFVDPVTGGMSFIRFRMLAEQHIQKSNPNEYALISLNVKRFKMINRMGGSIEGNEILCRIYEACRACLKDTHEIAAHGNADNFYLLLKNEGKEELQNRLNDLRDELEDLKTVLPVHISQGVYVVKDTEIDMIVFMDRANLARVSTAANYYSTCVFYNDAFVQQQEERVYMVGLIEEGLEKDEFCVFLQPKISPKKLKVIGAEALVRWNNPQRGIIGPNIFIPLCEQSGLICKLDVYVFTKVCEQIKSWKNIGWNCPIISVNISGQHLKDISFLKQYREIADNFGIDPSSIEMELTESIMFSNSEIAEARSIIDAIHEFGFRCSMDDFGSGYSALGLLQELPIDCIKLDKSFFNNSENNPRSQIIIGAIIKMAQRLFIDTVAEGIETERQVAMLSRMGCDMIQGYYYSPPLPMDEFAQMVFVNKTIYSEKGTSNKNEI